MNFSHRLFYVLIRVAGKDMFVYYCKGTNCTYLLYMYLYITYIYMYVYIYKY